MKAVRDDRRWVNFRLDVARILVSLGFGILLVCYWYLQFVRGSYYRSLSENNRLRSLIERAPRGVILDRQGRVLTENEPAFNLDLYKEDVRDLTATKRFLERALGLETREIALRLKGSRSSQPFEPVHLAEDIDISTVARTEAHALEHPELAIQVTEKRRYKSAPRAAHLLGYLGEATPEQIKREPEKFRPGDFIGLSGIEAAYNDHLGGVAGERTVVVDSLGREKREASRKAAIAGKSLSLSIDLRLQRVAESYFADKVGSVVALDPASGEVLALVSAPDFDPNAFVGRVSGDVWRTLVTDSRHPLQNRAIQNAYSPGSIFKIVMAYAVLERGIATPSDRVYCSGAATFYGNTFRCHKKGGHGSVDLRRAIEASCDVYFYTMGRRLGIDAIAEASRRFGLGEVTGIDLSPEKRGLVPSEAWSLSYRKHPWYAGETISVSIGQGPLLVTPVQMARMIAAVANGGRLVTPHLARIGKKVPAAVALPIPAKRGTFDVIRQGLWDVVNGGWGTGAAARVPGLDVCGKTGTVQVVAQKVATKSENLAYEVRDHAWFVAFAPREDPKIALAIFVEHGGHGGTIAAPLAAQLFRGYLLDEWPEEASLPAAEESASTPAPEPPPKTPPAVVKHAGSGESAAQKGNASLSLGAVRVGRWDGRSTKARMRRTTVRRRGTARSVVLPSATTDPAARYRRDPKRKA